MGYFLIPGAPPGPNAPPRTGPLDAATDSAKDDLRYVDHWFASKPFPMPSRMDAALQENTGIDPVYSSMPKPLALWTPIAFDPGGLLNLTRWYGDAQTGPVIAGIWLKTEISADHDQVKHVDVGWTREIWVFVNGKLAFQSKNLYGIKGASKEPGGRLSLTNGSFDLPLRKGANQIAVAIDDNFAGGQQHWGWGLEMRLANTDGIRQMGAVVANARGDCAVERLQAREPCDRDEHEQNRYDEVMPPRGRPP